MVVRMDPKEEAAYDATFFAPVTPIRRPPPTEADYWNMVVTMLREYPSYRMGQAMFNALHELYPDSARQLVGSDADPFYDNDNIARFLAAIDWLVS
jgi:hypothetical protein